MSGREEPSPSSREDAEWRSIVENFGERVELPDPEPPAPAPQFVAPDPGPVVEVPAELLPWDDEGHFEPPEPPPLPRPQGARLAAWFGVFGVPTLALLCVVLGFRLSSFIGLLMIVWFVGGFGYLVATMSSNGDSDGGWDDGAVL